MEFLKKFKEHKNYFKPILCLILDIPIDDTHSREVVQKMGYQESVVVDAL